MGDVEDAASAYCGGAVGSWTVCWGGMLDELAASVYSGRAGSVFTFCAVLLDASADFSMLREEDGNFPREQNRVLTAKPRLYVCWMNRR